MFDGSNLFIRNFFVFQASDLFSLLIRSFSLFFTSLNVTRSDSYESLVKRGGGITHDRVSFDRVLLTNLGTTESL